MLDTLVVAGSHTEPNDTATSHHEDWFVERAIALQEDRIYKPGAILNNTPVVRDYLRLKLMPEPKEVVVAVFLDNQYRVLVCEPCSRARSIRRRSIRAWSCNGPWS